jgi:hypothetical protein
MAYPKFDRNKLDVKRLAHRKNKVYIERDHIPADQAPRGMTSEAVALVEKTAARISTARKMNRSVMLAFGAHTIKNGLGPVLIKLMQEGWVTHLATNGAGIIHDWEFAFQGQSSEDVRENVDLGQFGIWDDTGFYINLALVAGAYEGLGYGESVGKMVHEEGLQIPEIESLYTFVRDHMKTEAGKAAAALDFADTIMRFNLPPGFMGIPHAYKKYSVQGNAFALGVPFTGHPMFGHDIIYTHPMNHGAAVGRTAEIDFLYYAQGVSNLEHGVYMSVGSAVMSPMIFEKSLSMSQNLAIQQNGHINNHYMLVVDLAASDWDWGKDGEPPPDHPAYYLRYCKTFHRMGGEMHYLTADNRDFLPALYGKLRLA